MSLEIGKKYFGILHLNKIGANTPIDTPICLHTEYGNLYVIRKDSDCDHCIGRITNCISGNNVHCSTLLIKKYNKQNKKVLTHFVNDRINEDNEQYTSTNWSQFYQDKLKTYLDSAI